MGGICSTHGETKNTYNTIGKPEINKPLQSCGRKRVDNIKMDLKRFKSWRCEMDSCGLGERRVADFCEHGDEPPASYHKENILPDQPR
jgi:hypothetical protein